LSFSGPSPAQVWEDTLGQLLLRVTRQNFDSWLRSTQGVRFEGTTLFVSTPSQLCRDWLASRMKTVIHQALAAVAGPGLKVEFEATESVMNPPEADPLQPSMIPPHNAPLNPRFTFASFLPGNHNRLALSAALDVCGNPESLYSPLFITGGPGSGKTHLLHAIAHQASKDEAHVVLVAAEQFLSEYTGALRNHTGPAFRSRYRDLDLLLVDDVHMLVGKKATQAEFFLTVAALHDLGRRVALAGDRHAITTGAGARFASQLHWGLVAEIDEPSTEDRIQFLLARTACQSLPIPQEVIHYIALRVRSCPRDLEGALNRVIALARISREPVSIDFAAKALQAPSDVPLAPRPQPSAPEVIRAVCSHLRVNADDVRGSRRTRDASYARHISMYIMRQDSGLTFSAIAQILGKKDHSAVVHACRQLDLELEVSSRLRADIDAVRAAIAGSGHAA
jgi:chromosomal replication initiator protein